MKVLQELQVGDIIGDLFTKLQDESCARQGIESFGRVQTHDTPTEHCHESGLPSHDCGVIALLISLVVFALKFYIKDLLMVDTSCLIYQ